MIVIGGGSLGEHCVGALAEGGFALPNTAITGAPYDLEDGHKLVAGG